MLRVTKWVTAYFVSSSFLKAFCDKRRACRRMVQGKMFARITSNIKKKNLQMIQRTNFSFSRIKTKENGRNRTNVWFFFSRSSILIVLTIHQTKRNTMTFILLLNQIANMEEGIRIYLTIIGERIFPVLILSYSHSLRAPIRRMTS